MHTDLTVDASLTILSTPAEPYLNKDRLRLSDDVVPVPSAVLSYVASSLEDFEASWQSEAGGATLLEGPRRK